MSALLPVALWGLEVPAGDVIVPATPEYPATFRITMAAIDPSAQPSVAPEAAPNGDAPARATLKIIRSRHDSEDESEGESDEEDYLKALLGGGSDSDDESHESDEDSDGESEDNGGPSDPERTKKALKKKEIEKLEKLLAQDDEDDQMCVDKPNGLVNKGKAKATGDESDSDEEGEELDVETFVICTLDPVKAYQQPLDITIGEDEQVFFKVSGTHTVYLTGNYVIPANDTSSDRLPYYDSDEDEEYDLSPDEDEIDDDEESDELDDIADPRIAEVDTDDEEEVPKLIQAKKEKKEKGKNKRPAQDSGDETPNLDDIMAKSLKPEEPKINGEQKLSKKQLKKLKNNAGEAVPKAVETKTGKKEEKSSKESSAPNKGDKKVQFAKDLEQGPANFANKPESNNDKVRTVQGVKIEDKVVGKGPVAKKGNKVSMRYIGKLLDGKQFEANKKGPPFSFKLGAGEVIKGWDIGVAGIAEGGQRRLTIPAHLAYGNKEQQGIPKNSTLIFEIKCLGIK
ncbi:hypothetical protein FGG08_002699 [Glutinoglossum americanum]|uniref:peptidylprolyl isomerase n=1 Tax=Glutinoglossum americanum TaxID=1670608 RepID=A0A9P8IEN2_9PEZI|nr:hypothetical protein FGG08_002699 [Glutinoglossum americanum]